MNKETLHLTFANNLRRYRQFKGYSQKELADHLKVNRPSVGSYEECRAFPSIFDFYRIAKIMGMSMDSLVKDEIHWRKKRLWKSGKTYLTTKDYTQYPAKGR